MLAVDVNNWRRSGAAASPVRLFCHAYGRGPPFRDLASAYGVVLRLSVRFSAASGTVGCGPGEGGGDGGVMRRAVGSAPSAGLMP